MNPLVDVYLLWSGTDYNLFDTDTEEDEFYRNDPKLLGVFRSLEDVNSYLTTSWYLFNFDTRGVELKKPNEVVEGETNGDIRGYVYFTIETIV